VHLRAKQLAHLGCPPWSFFNLIILRIDCVIENSCYTRVGKLIDLKRYMD
jgi:hypothetical protein